MAVQGDAPCLEHTLAGGTAGSQREQTSAPLQTRVCVCVDAQQQVWLTKGLHVAADQLRTLLPGLCHTHVTSDACSTRRIVDCYQALPLLHCHWLFSWDAQPLLFDLA